MKEYITEPFSNWREFPPEEMAVRAQSFYEEIKKRRSVRFFSNKAIDRAIIEKCLMSAGTAPSGANHQPWHFCVIQDQNVKKQIRAAAEAEEKEFYENKAPQEWLDALAPFGTDANKEFLEVAPYLIAIFAQKRGGPKVGDDKKNYYVAESVGIATGILITALQMAGLASLTHTPAPMNFLNEICARPRNEKPFMLLVIGYPAKNASIPIASRNKKPINGITSWL